MHTARRSLIITLGIAGLSGAPVVRAQAVQFMLSPQTILEIAGTSGSITGTFGEIREVHRQASGMIVVGGSRVLRFFDARGKHVRTAPADILSIAGPPSEIPDSAGNGSWSYVAITVSTPDEKMTAFLPPLPQRRCPQAPCARTSSTWQSLYVAAADRLYYYRPDRPEIAVFAMDGTLMETIDLGGLNTSSDYDTYPAIRSLRVDPAGRLWLQMSERAWRVTDPRGALLGSVAIPADLNVFEVGTDYILGVARDSGGVPRVRMYALQRR